MTLRVANFFTGFTEKPINKNCWILFVTTIFKLGPASWPNKSLLLLLEYNGYSNWKVNDDKGPCYLEQHSESQNRIAPYCYCTCTMKSWLIHFNCVGIKCK